MLGYYILIYKKNTIHFEYWTISLFNENLHTSSRNSWICGTRIYINKSDYSLGTHNTHILAICNAQEIQVFQQSDGMWHL